jgi:hypothetical protein
MRPRVVSAQVIPIWVTIRAVSRIGIFLRGTFVDRSYYGCHCKQQGPYGARCRAPDLFKTGLREVTVADVVTLSAA